MKPLPALFLTGCVYSFLVWAYVVVRLLVFNIQIWDAFIDGIPITFWQLGIIAFIGSAVCMFGFLISRE